MSKKWTNPHLVLRPATASSSEDNQHNQVPLDPLSNVTVLPESVDSSFLSRRDSTFSDTQYAFAAPTTNQYLDLPSAIPFQDFVSPALPSAEFPSSARGFVSPPGTSSTTNFPDPSSHQAVAATRPPSPGNERQSNPVISGHDAPPSANTHPIIATPAAGATALSRADSSVSYDSVWSGEGSLQHIALDINQFPRPPETAPDESSSTRSSPSVSSFIPARKPVRLKPPASPLYEESEPSASRPLTPIVGEVSYQYPVSTSSQQQSSTSLEQTPDGQDVDSLVIQYLRPQSDTGNGLILPSLAPTSARASYQSHITAASRGSSSPRMSIGDAPARASAGPESSAAWDEVMNTVKPHWYSSTATPAPRSPGLSGSSNHAAVGTSTTGQDDGISIIAPPIPANNLLSPFSGDESNSDVYSAIGRMSFPKPPILPASHDAEASPPISPGPPRSPWVTGLKLKTTSNRSSLATLKRRTEDSPMTSPLAHAIPPLPLSARDITAPTSAVLSPPLILSSPAEEYADAAYSSSGKESNRDSQRLGVPTESRNSSQSVEAPSYNRRVSDLLRAAAEPPIIAPRDSVTSTRITSSDSQRSSVDGAILGVARAASLSVRAKALLTQTSGLGNESQDATTPYIVPSPSTSFGPSETSLMLAPSIVTRVAPRTSPESDDQEELPVKLKRSNSRPASLPRPPPIQALGAFPESVGSGTSFDNHGYELSLSHFQSRDMPHSAVPLNQSTPFENYFPYPSNAPSAHRHPKHEGSFDEPGLSAPALNHSQSKPKSGRSSVMSRASSRAAKAMSWFRKKPLPSLPSSPTHEKKEKVLTNPDNDMSVPDLALRAAAMDHYLEVGELPYNSTTISPLPQGQAFARRGSGPRQSIVSVLSSMSDRARGERRTRSVGFSQIPEAKVEPNQPSSESFLSSRRRKILYFALFFCIVAAAVPLGVVYGRRALNNTATVSRCPDGLAGASCQLNSTCVCTSETAGRCDPVAKSLVDLVPAINSFFGMNVTFNSLALQLWDLQGQPATDCASQAILVDVSPALNQTALPKRTEWARAAILYNLLRTYDLAATETFRSLVSSANVGSLQDTPVTDSPANLKFMASGFEFDIAAMTSSATAVSWINNSLADATQVERVGGVAGRVLDRMYSFAFASSTQRCTALRHYWTTDLQLSEDLLTKFESSFSSAPILLPFDAASGAIAEFLASVTQNNGSSFPAPLACLPGLPDQVRTNIGTIEQHAFDLAALGTPPSSIDPACFPDRPTYGVLDVLRLRRPFGDARDGMRVTTAQLISQAGARAILHGGELLVGLTGYRDNGPATQGNMTVVDANPRCYGTLDNLDHIALSYLQAFPNVDLAKKAALFIADANDETAPPTSGNALLDGTTLENIPTIEVAVFGSILPQDIKIFHADLATPNGTLFFGSKSGDIFRKWALRDSDDQIRWSNSSTSPHVVRELKANNTTFEKVWNQAADVISDAANVGRGTGLPEVTRIMESLRNASLFS